MHSMNDFDWRDLMRSHLELDTEEREASENSSPWYLLYLKIENFQIRLPIVPAGYFHYEQYEIGLFQTPYPCDSKRNDQPHRGSGTPNFDDTAGIAV
jgi:hypothetical protein